MIMVVTAIACEKSPSFTEQLAHASIGGALALSVFMLCVVAVAYLVLR